MKLCECGCGNPAPIADRNRKEMGWIKGEPKRFISGHNSHGETNPNWKGTHYTRIAEKALGKPLPDKAVIHHHTAKQLIICEDQAYHMLLHQRARAFNACGHANWRKCKFCKKYDDPENLFISSKPGGHVYHPQCAANDMKNRNYTNRR